MATKTKLAIAAIAVFALGAASTSTPISRVRAEVYSDSVASYIRRD
jgi:hypothetical protein